MPRYNTSLDSNTIAGTTTISSPKEGDFTTLTGASGYTVTLPAPFAFPGSNFTFYNATSPAGVVTISTPSGSFSGTGGPNASTYNISAGNVISVTSDGSNYIVISEDGSPLTATTGAFSGNVEMTGGLSVTGSGTLSLNPSSTGAINNVNIGASTRGTAAFSSLSANAAVTLTANTASSSTTTGTLVVTGGIGASGTVNAATVAATTLTGTVSTAAQPNITSVGTLSGLTVTNTITGSVSGSAATVTGAAQSAITSVGTLSGLTVTNTITGSVSGTASAVTTAAQPNITSLGTLTGLTVNGVSNQTNGLYAERTFNLGYFPDTVANQVVYLNFGNNFINGNMEVTVTSTYSFQNATGILRKVFSFGFNTNNSQWYPATSRVSEANGPIIDNIVIGEMEWDSSGSQYRLPIYHVVSSGNEFYAHVRALGSANIVPAITVSGFSTRSSPTTAATGNVTNFPNNVNFGGRVNRPNQPAFFAIGLPSDLYATSGNQSQPITFRDCRLNNGSHWNGTIGSSTNNGNRFTAPVAGLYYFAWEGMYKHAGGGDITMQIWRNGAVVSYNNCHMRDNAGYYPAWSMAQVNWLGSMAAGDYIDFRMSSSADGSTFWYAGGLYNKSWGYLI